MMHKLQMSDYGIQLVFIQTKFYTMTNEVTVKTGTLKTQLTN